MLSFVQLLPQGKLLSKQGVEKDNTSYDMLVLEVPWPYTNFLSCVHHFLLVSASNAFLSAENEYFTGDWIECVNQIFTIDEKKYDR